MKNLEIKASCRSHFPALNVIKKIRAKPKGILVQKDVYFKIDSGRLKLRSISRKQHELIFYRRASRKNARYSNYEIAGVKDPRELQLILTQILGLLVTVDKKRALYIYQNVRIHLDTVKGLGKFIEFEIVCNTRKDELQAPEKMKFLVKEFGIESKDLVAVSYSDILLNKKKKGRN